MKLKLLELCHGDVREAQKAHQWLEEKPATDWAALGGEPPLAEQKAALSWLNYVTNPNAAGYTKILDPVHARTLRAMLFRLGKIAEEA
jgi:hypothetical protein